MTCHASRELFLRKLQSQFSMCLSIIQAKRIIHLLLLNDFCPADVVQKESDELLYTVIGHSLWSAIGPYMSSGWKLKSASSFNEIRPSSHQYARFYVEYLFEKHFKSFSSYIIFFTVYSFFQWHSRYFSMTLYTLYCCIDIFYNKSHLTRYTLYNTLQ